MNLYLLIPSSQSMAPPHPPLLSNHKSISVCFIDLFICVVVQIPHVSDTYFWLSLLSILLDPCCCKWHHFHINGWVKYTPLPHIFISSSLSGHLCWFHILEQCCSEHRCMYPFQPCFSLGGVAHHRVALVFSVVAVPIYIPTNNVGEGSFFFSPTPCLAFIICRLYDGHSHQCEMVFDYSFDLHFSNSDVEHRTHTPCSGSAES